MLSECDSIVFLLDVDNTLLDNDRFSDDLDDRLRKDFGESERVRYRDIYSELRDRMGFADYLGTLQEFRRGITAQAEEKLLGMSMFLLDYPFAQRVYPNVREVIQHLDTIGTTAILSDGDIVFQPRKIQRSGLWDMVHGRVMLTMHKELSVDDVEQRYPADHYVMVDDKPSLLSTLKAQLGERITTVFVAQGHYANDPDNADVQSNMDISLASITELASVDRGRFLPRSSGA
ncbi:MAG: HAD family hydrolase [Dokdonella sp.]